MELVIVHVAYVLTGGNRDFAGGVPAVVLARARYLIEHGFEVSVVCEGAKDFDRQVDKEGIHVYPVRQFGRLERPFQRLHTFSPIYLRALGRGLAQAADRKRVDLVDLQDAPAIVGVEPYLRRSGTPMALTVHGSALLNPAPRPWVGRKLHVMYEQRASRIAAKIFPVSKFIGTAAVTYGIADSRIEVIPNVVPSRFENLVRDRRSSDGPLRVLFLARVSAEKRLDMALRAIAKLPLGTVFLDVVGDGPQMAQCRELAASLRIHDRVKFYGFVHDPVQIDTIIGHNEVFVLPTVFEAMSIAILEAVAAGLFPIVSDIPSTREVLPPEFTFRVDDPDSLASKLREVAEDRSRITEALPSLRKIASGFRAESVYPRLLSAYCEIVADAHRRGFPENHLVSHRA